MQSTKIEMTTPLCGLPETEKMVKGLCISNTLRRAALYRVEEGGRIRTPEKITGVFWSRL
jgi:hypothetical protein